MEQIGEYILSVGAAGLLCAITARLAGNRGLTAKALKLVTGLFMLLTLLQPFGNFRLDRLDDWIDGYTIEAESAVAVGENQTTLLLQNSIKEGLASYILDKGADHGAALTVQIELDKEIPPNLLSVTLEGDISPYAKQALQQELCRELGLADEDILWQ